jgi:hypothetical protein
MGAERSPFAMTAQVFRLRGKSLQNSPSVYSYAGKGGSSHPKPIMGAQIGGDFMQTFIGAVNGYGVNLIDQNLEIYKNGELVTIQAVRLGAEELVKFLNTAKDVHLAGHTYKMMATRYFILEIITIY